MKQNIDALYRNLSFDARQSSQMRVKQLVDLTIKANRAKYYVFGCIITAAAAAAFIFAVMPRHTIGNPAPHGNKAAFTIADDINSVYNYPYYRALQAVYGDEN